MLQRIQTVYLLLASICMVVSLLTNLAVFTFGGEIVNDIFEQKKILPFLAKPFF